MPMVNISKVLILCHSRKIWIKALPLPLEHVYLILNYVTVSDNIAPTVPFYYTHCYNVSHCSSAPSLQCQIAPVPPRSSSKCSSTPSLQCQIAPVPYRSSVKLLQCPLAPVSNCSSALSLHCQIAPVPYRSSPHCSSQ